jgi:catechol 2,3-dioxygenase-like lactoylglutathione lyase family enzyme
MTSGRGIDHVGIATRDLDALAAQYEALGFTLTPLAHHQDHKRTSNRLVQFEGQNFIELLTVDRPETMLPHGPGFMGFGQFNHDFLASREGMDLIVFQTEDRDADLARWKRLGLESFDAFDFERQATLPDGSQTTVRFELGFVVHRKIEALFYVCRTSTPDALWKPEYQSHSNGALGIEAIALVAENPAEHAMFISSLFGGEIAPVPCGVTIQCGAGQRIEICPPERLERKGWVDEGRAPGVAQAAGLLIRTERGDGQITQPRYAGGAFIQWTKP